MAANAVPVCMCGGSNQTISAAEQDLPANLCPLIKSSYGYAKLKWNPFLEMSELLVGETTCDGKKKMFEILGQTRPMYILELPQKVDDKQAFEHWKQELVKFKKYLEKEFGTRITNKRLKGAIKLMNQERQLRRQIAELAKPNPPLLSGLDILNAKSLISGIPEDFKVYKEIVSYALRKGSKDDGLPAGRQGRPRILVTGVPMPHEAEKVMKLIEQSGGAVVAQENCTGLRPIDTDVREDIDPIQALAEKYFYLPCSVMTPNTRRLEALDRLIKQYQPQAVIELIWQGCLTYDVESYFIRRHIKQKHRLPYLKIETNYSPSDAGQLKSRIQALLEMID